MQIVAWYLPQKNEKICLILIRNAIIYMYMHMQNIFMVYKMYMYKARR